MKDRARLGASITMGAASDEGYRDILGGIDLVTAKVNCLRARGVQRRFTTDCILQGVVLRDGVPLVLHSDHAKEFVSKCVRMLARALGVTTTTTLAHHPTGNAKIERLWQYVVVPAATFSRNSIGTGRHTCHSSSILGTPRCIRCWASHRSGGAWIAGWGMTDRWTAAEYNAPSYMDGPGIKAMQTTAKALCSW